MKVFVTSRVPEEILKDLESEFELNYHDSNIPMTKEELIEGIKDSEILVCPLSDKIDKEIIDNGKELKLIANYGAGYDNIDINYAREKGIIVTNAPAPSSAVSTAELAFTLMLCASRKIVQSEKDLRAGNFKGWRPTYFLGNELRDKTLGIIGMGNIGRNLAKRALAFEMKVVYNSRTRKEEVENLGIDYVEKEELIKNSDFISLHSAFVPELKHMISTKEFDMMKESAIFINAARGTLVDEKALVEALKNNKIKSAGLDVYEFEPKVTEELLNLDNITLLPHLGNATFEARMEMGRAVVENLVNYKHGEVPINKVN